MPNNVARFVRPLVVFLAFACGPAFAQTVVTVAVENKDYTPYYTWEDGAVAGPCGDLVVGAFDRIGYTVEFVSAPWVRVLKMIEDGVVDAALCATRTENREAYAVFPDEALLSYDATLFVQSASPLAQADLEALKGRSFGMVKGYTFAGIDDRLEAIGMIRQETTTRESLVQVLVAGRVDAVLDTRLPFFDDAERLGVADAVRALAPSLSETPGYLMFSDRNGGADLAQAFSDALVAFKQTDAYEGIAARYRLTD